MAERRDYGRVTGYSAPIINVDTIQYSQVFKATHNGEGIKLPSLYRSFISFSFGGKDIEDFISKTNAAGGFWIGRYEARKKQVREKIKLLKIKMIMYMIV